MTAIRHSPDLPARFHTLSRSIQSLLFPPSCVGCDAVGAFLCPRCAQRVLPLDGTICGRCGRTQPKPTEQCVNCADEDRFTLNLARAAALHRSPLREAIHAFKYEQRTELAETLAGYLVAAYSLPPWRQAGQEIDLVVPVPLHPDRLRERGFNQSALLAQVFCRRTGLTLGPDGLERMRDTPHQVGLDAAERRRNVDAAFHASPIVSNRRILLIDDVYTTGATLNACATAAFDVGASRVYALTLAIPQGDHA